MLWLALAAFLSSVADARVGERHGSRASSSQAPDSCPGYAAKNVITTSSSLSADLVLAGQACNIFGQDLGELKLSVVYEDVSRIHVKITDPAAPRYEVPESVLPRPTSKDVPASSADIRFNFTHTPFSFSIIRNSNGDILFDTANHPLVYEPQYLRVKTSLPANANIYGLGEHTDSFRLPTHNATRTMWSRDAFGVPPGTNLYGDHPIYFEHRHSGTHGVFLVNSNGMDIKIDDTDSVGTTLEYNIIGGILDFYFLAGSTSSPVEVAKQYSAIVGTPAEVPYWSFGFHQCRFNYTDFVAVADVITNYSAAGIPLETMWTDIDYMDRRRTFTNDPDYFPTARVREIVSYLHSHEQQYVMMVDPAVGFLENQGYGPFDRGVAKDVFLKNPNGTIYKGLVWPGVTAFPDWFNNNTQSFWTEEFQRFFDPGTGFDIDGVWLDMNEPSSFCSFPCDDPEGQARAQDLPPPRLTAPPAPDAPIFQNTSTLKKRQQDDVGVELLHPPYAIQNAAGTLSDKTAYTNVLHADGNIMYNTHNLYGTMMSAATRDAMEARRPGLRPFLIVRSTFAGAGRKFGKWLGDNISDWVHYRLSIAGQLGMASIYQIPMVGSDVCGFAGDTTDLLCARWAMLGAFSPFYRDHNQDISIPQEFYRWPIVAQAAKNAISIRYRLLDYFYTAFHKANADGTPVLNPMWFFYPSDPATWPIDLQFFYGDSILVSPVTEENSTSVGIYLPKDTFYDFQTLEPIQGKGQNVSLTNVNFTTIPVYVRSGAILPLRMQSAMTTVALRKNDFDIVVAPNSNGTGHGSLYLDDGVSLVQKSTTDVTFSYSKSKLAVTGQFGFQTAVRFAQATFLNVRRAPGAVLVEGKPVAAQKISYDGQRKVLKVKLDLPISRAFDVELH